MRMTLPLRRANILEKGDVRPALHQAVIIFGVDGRILVRVLIGGGHAVIAEDLRCDLAFGHIDPLADFSSRFISQLTSWPQTVMVELVTPVSRWSFCERT